MTTQHYRRPSIFELLTCDRLKNGLREALRYLLNNLNQVEGLTKILPPTDETVLVLDLLVEYSYLKTYNASYAENLYNLIRLSKSTGSRTQRILPSLVCLTLVPYLKHKLDKYFENLQYKETRTASELTRIRIYRLITRSGSFLNLCCMLRYSAGNSAYHDILDGAIGICLKGRLEEQIDADDESSTQIVLRGLADNLGRILTVGSCVIQFLDYWHTHNNSASLFNASLPIPEPPSKDGLAYTDDRSSNICLICEHVRQNECALSNTGYVFCYGCIYKYVKSKQRCPITGHPATVDNIVRLFTSTLS